MLDWIQIASTLAVLVAAVLAMISVILTYRISVRVRSLEVTLRTKEGAVSSDNNEEDANGPALEKTIGGEQHE